MENSTQSQIVDLFTDFQQHIDAEQQIREVAFCCLHIFVWKFSHFSFWFFQEIKVITRQIDTINKSTTTTLQVIHSNLAGSK